MVIGEMPHYHLQPTFYASGQLSNAAGRDKLLFPMHGSYIPIPLESFITGIARTHLLIREKVKQKRSPQNETKIAQVVGKGRRGSPIGPACCYQ